MATRERTRPAEDDVSGWALGAIALDVWLIWALTRPGALNS